MGGDLEMERACFVALWRVNGVGLQTFARLISFFGSAQKLFGADAGLIEQALGHKSEGLIRRLLACVSVDPMAELVALEQSGVRVYCFGLDDDYPANLLGIDRPPPVLFVRGSLLDLDRQALAVVGTRKPSEYGLTMARQLVGDLVKQSVTIVSGMARGIDGMAHRSALEHGGRTIAVLGGGIDHIYPAMHRGLADQIMKSGALVSLYGPGVQPRQGSFVERNRIIAGLSLGTLVVEGAAKSGTRVTANFTFDQQKPVYALPGPVTSRLSQAPLELVQEGAVMIRNAGDILKHMQIGQNEKSSVTHERSDRLEQRVVELLSEHGVQTVDEMVKVLGVGIGDMQTALTMLEMDGCVVQVDGSFSLVR